MLDTITDLYADIRHNGFSWLTAISILLLVRKNRLKRKESAKIDMILNHLSIPIPIERRFKMPSNINLYTLLPSLVGGIKLVLQAFNITIPDETINMIFNGLAALLMIAGIIYNHYSHSPKKEEVNAVIATAVDAAKQGPKNYNDLVPIINQIHITLNQMGEQVRTGKYTDAVSETIDTYKKVHDLIVKKEV